MKIHYLFFLIAFLAVDSSCSFVISTSSLPNARYDLAATSVGDYAIFAGGIKYPSTGPCQTVDILHVPTHQWMEANLTEARSYMVAASAGGYALFAGGQNGAYTQSDLVDIWNSSSLKWTRSTLSEPRSLIVSTSVGKYAIFAGGLIEDRSKRIYSDTVDIFDSSTLTWSVAKLSSARKAFSGASAGKYALFMTGDRETFFFSDLVDIFDSTTQQWTTTKLRQPLIYSMGVSLGRYAIFAGLYANETHLWNFGALLFDSETMEWSAMDFPDANNNMSFTEPAHPSTSAGHYALFGAPYKDKNDNRIMIYDSLKNEWTFAVLEGERPYGYAATSVGNTAIFAGGLITGNVPPAPASSDVVFIEFDSAEPSSDSLPIPASASTPVDGVAPTSSMPIAQRSSGSLSTISSLCLCSILVNFVI